MDSSFADIQVCPLELSPFGQDRFTRNGGEGVREAISEVPCGRMEEITIAELQDGMNLEESGSLALTTGG